MHIPPQGPLAVAKTAVRLELVSQHAFAYLRSSEYLRGLAKAKGLSPDRLILQDLGDSLDVATAFFAGSSTTLRVPGSVAAPIRVVGLWAPCVRHGKSSTFATPLEKAFATFTSARPRTCCAPGMRLDRRCRECGRYDPL